MVIPSAPTFRRFANWYKANYFDKWILLRDGEKALKEDVIPHIKRDVSKIEVGEVLVADGKRLNFQVINPFTGKPTRATLIGFLDWKSGALAGYEIMIEENTQNIASALRNTILNLKHIPKFVYLDNGKAFRGKYFVGSSDFNEIGFKGIYEKLGITTVFANPYNARSKVIERFWKEMQESLEKLLPSYIGTSIENKPARLRRNEKFHSEIHQGFVPTISQTIQMINSWLEYKNSLPCATCKEKTVAQMLDNIEKQEVNEQQLDDLTMATVIKTITSQGIRFLKADYYNDALYGLRQKVIIKYSLFNLSYIKVYTINGKFLCKAERITLTHNLILKAAKKLKTFTLDDIAMLCNIDTALALKTLMESKNMNSLGNNNFKYIELLKAEDKFKIINKNINCKNSDITVFEARNIFLENTQKLKCETFRTYKSYINAHIIPYFGKSKLKNISIFDVEKFRKNMQTLLISERRIKNILALLK